MLLLETLALPEPADPGSTLDEGLLLQVAAGDQEAFRKLYEDTDRTIYGFILSSVQNPQDAEEVMQETYMKVWTSAPGYRAHVKLLAWMFTIARNLCYMRFREQKHRSDLGLDDLDGAEMGQLCPQIEDAADKLVLQAALTALGEEDRQIVLLKKSAGMKHREIAEALGMPVANVVSR